MDYFEARTELMKLPGVGPKVADCVLLFAYNFYQSVPVDVWIRTIITRRYPAVFFQPERKGSCTYDRIACFCRDYFGEYAGYAQQFLFASRLESVYE
jgi:N-glycosylase/DNA lyase